MYAYQHKPPAELSIAYKNHVPLPWGRDVHCPTSQPSESPHSFIHSWQPLDVRLSGQTNFAVDMTCPVT
jgi:hypothetical protein